MSMLSVRHLRSEQLRVGEEFFGGAASPLPTSWEVWGSFVSSPMRSWKILNLVNSSQMLFGTWKLYQSSVIILLLDPFNFIKVHCHIGNFMKLY